MNKGNPICIVELLPEVIDMSDIWVNDIADTKLNDKEVKSAEFAKGLGIAESTVRKYAQQLESAGYVFKKDTNGARIFTVEDFEVFTDLIRLKSKPGISLEIAANISVSQKSKTIQRYENVQPLAHLDFNEIMIDTKKTIQALQNSFETKFEEIKRDRFTAAIIIRRIEAKLRKEAKKKWEEQPDEVRLVVKGIIFKKKEENFQKKHEFIQEYIDEHIEEYLDQEIIDTNNTKINH